MLQGKGFRKLEFRVAERQQVLQAGMPDKQGLKVYIQCFVRVEEGKRHNVFFPEGKGIVKGWAIIMEKLQELGVKETQEKKTPCYSKVTSKGHYIATPSYVEVVQRSCNNAVWVDASDLDPKESIGMLKNCLVGRWKEPPDSIPMAK